MIDDGSVRGAGVDDDDDDDDDVDDVDVDDAVGACLGAAGRLVKPL